MFKKIICLIFALVLVISLSACGEVPESLTKKNNKDIITLTKYSYSESGNNVTQTDFEVPENYIPINEFVYAELNSNSEIISYQKAVLDPLTGKYIFKECDVDGNILDEGNNVSDGLNSIMLSENNITLLKDETKTLTITTDPSDFTITETIWESSKSEIATVENGVITAKGVGETVITASIGKVKATCNVTVTEEKKPETVIATGISLSKTTASVYIGSTVTITATVSPSNATDKTVTWVSSNTNIATVSNGKIKGVAAGTATITAKNSAGQTATCTITVSKKQEPEKPKDIATTGISLDKPSQTVFVGDSVKLTATVAPSNATNKTVTWSSSNNSVATVNNGTVTAVSAGTATITAKASGGQTATFTITVKVKETVQAFSWSNIKQTDCPMSISEEFDKYTLSSGEKFLAISKNGNTYVLLKAAQGQKISVSSITESNGKITIKYSNSGTSNYIFVKFNRENTNISYTK